MATIYDQMSRQDRTEPTPFSESTIGRGIKSITDWFGNANENRDRMRQGLPNGYVAPGVYSPGASDPERVSTRAVHPADSGQTAPARPAAAPRGIADFGSKPANASDGMVNGVGMDIYDSGGGHGSISNVRISKSNFDAGPAGGNSGPGFGGSYGAPQGITPYDIEKMRRDDADSIVSSAMRRAQKYWDDNRPVGSDADRYNKFAARYGRPSIQERGMEYVQNAAKDAIMGTAAIGRSEGGIKPMNPWDADKARAEINNINAQSLGHQAQADYYRAHGRAVEAGAANKSPDVIRHERAMEAAEKAAQGLTGDEADSARNSAYQASLHLQAGDEWVPATPGKPGSIFSDAVPGTPGGWRPAGNKSAGAQSGYVMAGTDRKTGKPVYKDSNGNLFLGQ